MSSKRFRVALTFDAELPGHPHWRSANTIRILEALAAQNSVATFFLQGRWVAANPGAARAIVAAGHLVGNHSHHHAPARLLTEKGMRHDILTATDTIRDITAADPVPWFRFPYGDGADDRRALGVLAEIGYQHVHWNVDSHDWMEKNTSDDVRRRVLDGVRRAGDGAVVLMHSWPKTTATALPLILEDLALLHVRCVTVDELMTTLVDAA